MSISADRKKIRRVGQVDINISNLKIILISHTLLQPC